MVSAVNAAAAETLGVAGRQEKNLWHGREKRPTMYLAGMDIKTAFDVARPKHTAKIMGDQAVHGWITEAITTRNGRLGRTGNI